MMTDEDMKQYLPLWREANALEREVRNHHTTASDYRIGLFDRAFLQTCPTYQAIKLMAEGWKPETREDVAREMLARAYPYNARHFRSGEEDMAVTRLARCLPDGFKIADLPEVEV